MLDEKSARAMLVRFGGIPSCIQSRGPGPKPPGHPLYRVVDPSGGVRGPAWRSLVEEDLGRPAVGGDVVLASTAVQRATYRNEEWTIEQYFGAAGESAATDLIAQLATMPRVVACDTLVPLYEGPAAGAVVAPEYNFASPIGDCAVALCPRVAKELGWASDPRDAFTYRDRGGHVAARTLHWRDGGIPSRAFEVQTFREGFMLLVKEKYAEDVRSFVSSRLVVRAWRLTQNQFENTPSVSSASMAVE